MTPLAALQRQVASVVPTLEGWCSPERAGRYARYVLERAFDVSVCLGVWGGRDVAALALAHKTLGRGRCVAVDAWNAEASVVGQTGADVAFWSRQDMHEKLYRHFLERLAALELNGYVEVHRARSRDVSPPTGIGLLIVDGNHGPDAITDVERWAPNVIRRGIVYLDDLDWAGGAVRVAEKRLVAMGFRSLGAMDTGAFYERA